MLLLYNAGRRRISVKSRRSLCAGACAGVAAFLIAVLCERAETAEGPREAGPTDPSGDRDPRPEIVRDTWGILHIFASTRSDGFCATVYACAEDRILQMNLIRRKVAGRLAEVFGPGSVDSDSASRIAGHAVHCIAAYERLPERLQGYLKACAAGVNTYIKAQPESVARRFRLLGIPLRAGHPRSCRGTDEGDARLATEGIRRPRPGAGTSGRAAERRVT
jgi:acyl-homoserine lactone acylase PvdQ